MGAQTTEKVSQAAAAGEHAQLHTCDCLPECGLREAHTDGLWDLVRDKMERDWSGNRGCHAGTLSRLSPRWQLD